MLYSRLPASPKPSPNYIPYIVAGLAVILIGVAGLLYAVSHLPILNHTTTPPSARTTGNDSTKGEPTMPTNNQPIVVPSDSSKNGDDTGAKTLIAPLSTSNFVSTHTVSASGYLSSTCTTTPGATCQITFTKDSVTQSLPAEITDAGGSAYWNSWQPQAYYLGPGLWTVRAVATLGSQSLSTNDAKPLEVTP